MELKKWTNNVFKNVKKITTNVINLIENIFSCAFMTYKQKAYTYPYDVITWRINVPGYLLCKTLMV